MIAMSPTITLKGQVKFSLKKALVGGEMSKSSYTGPGELLLAPASIGDITIIKLSGHEQWSVGKDAFLACTQGIVTEYKSQGLSKAIFSGEGLFVYKISGQGILWCTSFGAIIRKDVSHPLANWRSLNDPILYLGLMGANVWYSCKRTKSTTLTMATSLPGTVNTSSSAWHPAVLYPTYPLARVWCASLPVRCWPSFVSSSTVVTSTRSANICSQVPEPSSCRHAMHRRSLRGSRRMPHRSRCEFVSGRIC